MGFEATKEESIWGPPVGRGVFPEGSDLSDDGAIRVRGPGRDVFCWKSTGDLPELRV